MNHERTTNDVVLSAQGVSKSYGKLEALTDLTFQVRAGEILGLLGPNGAGKTTAIRVLSTILPADRGQFTIMGLPHTRPEEVRARIGVLPESNGFPLDLTGEEFLVYMGRLYGQGRSQAAKKARELLCLFGLEKAGRRTIATYSRGMRQRLAVARSLINDPEVLFLDEPTLGFDPGGQREMLQVIRRAADENRTAVILSSHLLEVVDEICATVLILNHGRVVAEGALAEIKHRVSLTPTCRLQVPAEKVPQALAVLAAVEGVTADHRTDHKDEIIVAFEGQTGDEALNEILQRLIQAQIPIEAFNRDGVRLSDAFLSMIEEVQA